MRMASRESLNRTAAFLTVLVVALVILLATVATMQFRWTRQLQQQYEDSRQELLWLQNNCLDDSDPGVTLNVIREAVHRSLVRIESQDGYDRRERQTVSSLEQTLTDMMMAKEKELMANCLSNSKLCIPGQKGEPGTKGDHGISGHRGAAGENGTQGPKGDTGPDGSNGTVGDDGPQGARGLNGSQGPRGLRGFKGDIGATGKQGPSGKQGPRGHVGDKGVRGNKGHSGQKGNNGTAGLKGEKGDTGLNGTKGDIGLTGTIGAQGTSNDTDCACVVTPKIDIFTPNATSKFYPLGSHVRLTCGSSTSPNNVVTWSGPLDGCDPDHVISGQLDIGSLQPAHAGNYTCTVTNPYGSASKTVTISSNMTGALDCDFEDRKFCLWSNLKSDSMEWYNQVGHTPSGSTGPLSDHTLGNLKGHYAYIETSSGSTGASAVLASPEMGPSPGTCFSFWYNMFGSQIGSLNIETELCNSSTPNSIRLHLSRNQGQPWHLAQIQVPSVPHSHRILVKATKGIGIYGDIAIDDIQYYPGKCKSTLERTIHKNGHENVSGGDKAPLNLECGIEGIKPAVATYRWEKVGGCPLTTKSENPTIAKQMKPGDAGTYVCTATSASNTLKTTFNVTWTGPSVYKCTFENGQCDWTQPTDDEFDWILHQGPTQSKDTGPEVDHTFNTSSGHYMFIEASSPRTLGDTAVLKSHLMPGGSPACLTMAYHMFGVDTGSLMVLAEDSCTKKTYRLSATVGDQGNSWHVKTIPITPSSVPHDYHVLIKAEVGHSYHGDIGIDDLVLKTTQC